MSPSRFIPEVLHGPSAGTLSGGGSDAHVHASPGQMPIPASELPVRFYWKAQGSEG